MPEASCLLLSLLCLVVAVILVLFPHGLLDLSRTLNRTLMVLDDQLVKHRYLLSVLLVAVSYGLFRLSLLISLSRS